MKISTFVLTAFVASATLGSTAAFACPFSKGPETASSSLTNGEFKVAGSHEKAPRGSTSGEAMKKEGDAMKTDAERGSAAGAQPATASQPATEARGSAAGTTQPAPETRGSAAGKPAVTN